MSICKKPLRYWVTKWAIAGKAGEKFRTPTREIDFSDVVVTIHSNTSERFYDFQTFIANLANELGVSCELLPMIEIQGIYTVFCVPKDSQTNSTGDRRCC
jgi:hypothetical protein